MSTAGDGVGIIPRSARYLFDRIGEMRESQPEVKATIFASFCEVYNEQVWYPTTRGQQGPSSYHWFLRSTVLAVGQASALNPTLAWRKLSQLTCLSSHPTPNHLTRSQPTRLLGLRLTRPYK